MNQVTDANGNPFISINLALPENSTSATFAALIPCLSGYYLTADNAVPCTVKARRTGSGDAFADIDANPINLTPYAGQTISFDFQVVVSSVTQNQSAACPVRVTLNP